MNPSVAITLRRLASTYVLISISRFLDKITQLFGFTCVANRYGGTIYLFSTREDARLYSGEKKLSGKLINIGAGSFRHPEWTNVDLPSKNSAYGKIQGRPNEDFIPLDLEEAETLPFETNSAKAIYSSHCIEHLPYDVVFRLFMEFRRVLSSDGVIRITCPDAKLYAAIAINLWRSNCSMSRLRGTLGDIHGYLSELEETVLRNLFCKPLTEDTLLSRIAKIVENSSYRSTDPSEHLSWWTRDSIIECLYEAGFQETMLSLVGSSQFSPMRNIALFDNTLPELSLFVEARNTERKIVV